MTQAQIAAIGRPQLWPDRPHGLLEARMRLAALFGASGRLRPLTRTGRVFFLAWQQVKTHHEVVLSKRGHGSEKRHERKDRGRRPVRQAQSIPKLLRGHRGWHQARQPSARARGWRQPAPTVRQADGRERPEEIGTDGPTRPAALHETCAPGCWGALGQETPRSPCSGTARGDRASAAREGGPRSGPRPVCIRCATAVVGTEGQSALLPPDLSRLAQATGAGMRPGPWPSPADLRRSSGKAPSAHLCALWPSATEDVPPDHAEHSQDPAVQISGPPSFSEFHQLRARCGLEPAARCRAAAQESSGSAWINNNG